MISRGKVFKNRSNYFELQTCAMRIMIGTFVMKSFLIFIFISFMALSAVAYAEPGLGFLKQNGDLKTKGRLNVIDGTSWAGSVQLSYHAPPKGAYDGDSGSDLFIKVKNPNVFVAGKTFDVKDKRFTLYVTEWATPSGYNVYDQSKLSGNFKVIENLKGGHIQLQLNISHLAFGERTVRYDLLVLLQYQ